MCTVALVCVRALVSSCRALVSEPRPSSKYQKKATKAAKAAAKAKRAAKAAKAAREAKGTRRRR